MTASSVGDVVALKDRGKYQGVIEAITTVSNGVGPVLGGVFSTYTTWRWAFWINLPLAGLAMLVAWFLIPVKPVDGSMQAKLLKVDWVGSGLTILSSVLVLVRVSSATLSRLSLLTWSVQIGLTWGGSTYPWTSAAVLVPLLSGMAVVIPFVVWEARYATLPIIPGKFCSHS
jgi:MFS family permease